MDGDGLGQVSSNNQSSPAPMRFIDCAPADFDTVSCTPWGDVSLWSSITISRRKTS
ncbi:hypothetical protein PAMP_013464 [Pampus punctatissimus]